MLSSPSRSPREAILSWVALAVSMLCSIVGVLALLASRSSSSTLKDVASDLMGLPPLAEKVGGIWGSTRWFYLGFAIVSLLALGASAGLLKRQPWAKILLIAILVLATAWHLSNAAVMVREHDFFGAALGVFMSVLFIWFIRMLTTFGARRSNE
jgi:hypothetical protein